MNKRDFYAQFGLTPDSGNFITSWGAIQHQTGKYLLQCWNDEKTFIKREDRTDDAIMLIKVLSPKDLEVPQGGAHARVRTVAAIRAGACAYVAVSTGTYPNWVESANLDQVYPVLSVYEMAGEVFARVGSPVPIAQAFAR